MKTATLSPDGNLIVKYGDMKNGEKENPDFCLLKDKLRGTSLSIRVESRTAEGFA